MKRISVVNAALLFALFGGLWHAAWVVLISIDFATPLVDFVLWLHFFKLPLYVDPPSAPLALLLIGLTSLIGAGFGLVLALLWNLLALWTAPRNGRRAAFARPSAKVLRADTE